MENPVGRSIFERPPFLTGSDYSDYMYWKVKMRIFIQAMDYEMWTLIEDGPHRPAKIDVDGRDIDKEKTEWDENDRRLVQLDAKAVNLLHCALDHNAFVSVFSCESAKAIWEKLEDLYEGNARAKEMKISVLEEDYEAFVMRPLESINGMFVRFLHIANGLNSLGRRYSEVELVDKFLRSLSKGWKPLGIQIRGTMDLSRIGLHELAGLLMAHETLMKREKDEQYVVLK